MKATMFGLSSLLWIVPGLLFEADKLPATGFVLLMALGCCTFVRCAKWAGVWADCVCRQTARRQAPRGTDGRGE